VIVEVDYVTCIWCVKKNVTYMRKLRNCGKNKMVVMKLLYNYKLA